MPGESEFEAVVSEADVEAGVMPIVGKQGEPITDTTSEATVVKSGWSIWSLSGLQQLFDINTADMQGRLMSVVMPWKGKTLMKKIEEKPDLYVPVWMIATTALIASICDIILSVRVLFLGNVISYAFTYMLLMSIAAAGLWLLSSYLESNISLMSSFCVVSYMHLYIVAAFVIATLWKWMRLGGSEIIYFLLCASFLSVFSIFNLYPDLTQRNRIIGILGTGALVLYIALSWIFFV